VEAYTDIYGLESEYTGYLGEVELSEEDFLEPEPDSETVVEILETGGGVQSGEDEFESGAPEDEFSYLERSMAHLYAGTTVAGFRALEGTLKATFRTLEFLARRS
jgi:hypothetical protein